MRVTLLYARAPREVLEAMLDVADGCTAQAALQASGWLDSHPEVAGHSLAVWGRRCAPDAVLREGDRLEVLRPLRVDPKVARRERFKGQGARGAGLFAQRRPNSKSGY